MSVSTTWTTKTKTKTIRTRNKTITTTVKTVITTRVVEGDRDDVTVHDPEPSSGSATVYPIGGASEGLEP
jgi:hypothetical protein